MGMKMPEIPAEARPVYSLRTKQDYTILAVYCVAILEWLMWNALDEMNQEKNDDEYMYWSAHFRSLRAWRDEWMEWGGLP